MNIIEKIQQEQLKRDFENRLNFEKAERNSLISQVQDDVLKGMSEEEILEKARSGKYADTPENRKLGRVGQQYGSKKEEGDFKIINDSNSISDLLTPIWRNKSKGFLYFTDGLRVDIPTIKERLDKSGDRKWVSLLDVTGNNGENKQDPHTFKNDKIANSYSIRINKRGRFELLQHKID